MDDLVNPAPARRNHVPEHLLPGSPAPVAAALDELGRSRVRRLLAGYLDDFPTLDAHVALLDTRTAWYAEKALANWTPAGGDSFFGLVRHVVRTQLAGPPPQPDVEGWLASGRPQEPDLAAAFDELYRWRWLPGHRPEVSERTSTTTMTEAFDVIVREWPAGEFGRFVTAYARLEYVLERRQLRLPPIDE